MWAKAERFVQHLDEQNISGFNVNPARAVQYEHGRWSTSLNAKGIMANAPPKVPYPWHDPTNPSNWKEEHVRICDASRATATRDRSRDAATRARDRSIDPTRRECHD